MPFPRDRGSALVADLALAAIVVLVVASTLGAAGAVTAARETGLEAARTGAVTLARLGDPVAARAAAEALAGTAVVTVESTDGVARTRVTVRVELAHPLARRIPITVSEVVEVPVAPYRSNRG